MKKRRKGTGGGGWGWGVGVEVEGGDVCLKILFDLRVFFFLVCQILHYPGQFGFVGISIRPIY